MNSIFIFDVDGVITNPETKKPNREIISFIASQLNNDQFIAIATGRSAKWVIQYILPEIKKKLVRNDSLGRLFASCEKGGVILTFDKGTPVITNGFVFSMPRHLQQQIKAYVEKADGIFFDKDKETMISIEIDGGSNARKLTSQKKQLDKLTEWVNKDILPFYPNLSLERTHIAVDIQSKLTSKRESIKALLTFLPQGEYVHKRRFIAFGDSATDMHLAEALKDNGYSVTFVYVGEGKITEKTNFPVIYPKNSYKYDRAAAELLKDFLTSKGEWYN